jgi:hypothetical protein
LAGSCGAESAAGGSSGLPAQRSGRKCPTVRLRREYEPAPLVRGRLGVVSGRLLSKAWQDVGGGR